MAGAAKVTKTKMQIKMLVTIVETMEVKKIDNPAKVIVKRILIPGGASSIRVRKIGKRANIWIENSIRAKTEISSCSREARTTDPDIAAFMERTEVNLSRICRGSRGGL